MGVKARGLNGLILLRATASSAEDGVAVALNSDQARGIKEGDSIIFPPGEYYTFDVDNVLILAVPLDGLIAVISGED